MAEKYTPVSNTNELRAYALRTPEGVVLVDTATGMKVLGVVPAHRDPLWEATLADLAGLFDAHERMQARPRGI